MNPTTLNKFDEVNRLEVINENGRLVVLYNVSITLSLQDDGKTLKVFTKELDGGE